MTPPVVLSVSATDSGGGAGLAADLATFAALGVHGTCVVTAVTAQDTVRVRALHRVPLEIVVAQLEAVLADLDPVVVKTGVLGSAEVVRLVADRCAGRTLVVDPVLRATTGALFAPDDVLAAYREHLLPVATVVTPNSDEAAVLRLGKRFGADSPPAAAWIATGGADADVLHRSGQQSRVIRHDVVDTANDHGTGCTHASALAAYLAHGEPLEEAARRAAAFVGGQLRTSRSWDLGRGAGPVAHTFPTSTNTPTTEEIPA